jgi:hypothetical protein
LSCTLFFFFFNIPFRNIVLCSGRNRHTRWWVELSYAPTTFVHCLTLQSMFILVLYPDLSNLQVAVKVGNRSLSPSFPHYLSEEVKSLLASCFHYSPEDRPTFEVKFD